jgi:hypothetical protein
MPRIIEKKCWPKYFDLIVSGKKKYDFRLDDFVAEAGNTIVFKEWDPEIKDYTGRTVKKIITQVGKLNLDDSFWPKEEIEALGLKIMSLE